MDQKQYTSGQAAGIVKMPHPTLRSWDQRGFLAFLRDVADDENDVMRGQWAWFVESDIMQIAVMYELTKSGLGPALAALFVEHTFRPVIVDETIHSQLLAVARIGDLYAVTIAPSLGTLDLPTNWYYSYEGRIRWRVDWVMADGQAADLRPDFCVPVILTTIDMRQIRARVADRIKKQCDSVGS
jgi:hypothetical protein